jgi:iron complex outermembrane recepter protein
VFQNNLDKRSLRSALLLGAASAAAVGFSAQALAQEQSTEVVVVTGSRIPQQGIYAPSPVTAVGQQELKFEGTVGVETLLNNLPSVFANQTAGVSNGATGEATVDLRGLGSVRTLVLVNGTRLMPGDPAVPVPDLNQIPAALVDHVEVLTGGASAVYGSDAMAGVVNFIMRKDFEGIELDAQYGVSEADNTNASYRNIVSSAGDPLAKEGIWDGASDTGTLIVGANTGNGRGNVTAYIGYENTEAVLAGARDFSACTFEAAGATHTCGGSSTDDRLVSLDNTGAKQPASFFEEGTGAVGSGTFVPYVGSTAQLYNFGATNYLQRPDTRYTGGFFAHYQVNKELEVYSSFMFTDDYTVSQIAARGLFGGVGAISGLSFAVNCSNPLMTPQEATELCGLIVPTAPYSATQTLFQKFGAAGPFGNGYDTGNNGLGNKFPGQADVEIGRRAVEGGPDLQELGHTSYRLQVGARGDLGDGWTYDVYAQYGESIFARTALGFFSTKNSANALQATGTAANPVCISGSPCVPLDVFNGMGSITPAMLNYVKVPALQNGYTEEQIVSGSITGDLGEYGIQSPWAKAPVAVSLGSEYRAEYLELQPDEEYLSGDLNGAGGATLATPRSGFTVEEGFTELKAPLVQEKPWAEDLSLNAGYRYSSYSEAGSVSAYKYGLEYQPIDDFRVRASYERAVRAPTVLEAFAPNNIVLVSAQDPCSVAGNTLAACKSVTNNGDTALLQCPSNQCNREVGGNSSLRPEVGDTRTLGVVLTPSFLDGFTATVDYFNIDVSKYISGIPAPVTLTECYVANVASFCNLVHRNAEGQIYGNGFVAATNQNAGFLHTKGVDVEWNYNFDLDSIPMTAGNGSLQFAFVGTYLESFVFEPVPGGGTYNCAGLYGSICSVPGQASGPLPKWRHRLRMTWATPWDIDFSANWRYLSSVKLDTNTSNPLLTNGKFDAADASINDFWYLDLSADWNVRTGVDLHAGVNNVFDRLPPALSSAVLPVGPGNDNTFPGTYDPLGRVFFVGATIKY